MQSKNWWSWPGQASPLVTGMLLYPMLVYMVMAVVPPGPARRGGRGGRRGRGRPPARKVREVIHKHIMRSQKAALIPSYDIVELFLPKHFTNFVLSQFEFSHNLSFVTRSCLHPNNKVE